MIINMIDTKRSAHRVRRVCAALAGYAAFSGYNVLILQFENYDQDSIEKILFHEYRGDSYGFKTFEERGMDALLSEASMNNITKDTFFENVTAYAKNRRFDVADITRKTNLLALLEDRKEDVVTLLTAADQIYDFVFCCYGSKTPNEVFGHYNSEVAELVKKTIFVSRQGEWSHARDFMPEEKGKPAKYPENAIFIATKFDPESAMTMKVCAKRLETDAAKVFPLAEPIGFRDAMDNNKLQPYLRLNKNAADEYDSDACLWAQNLEDIIEAIKEGKRPQRVEEWSLQEYPRKELHVMPIAPEDEPEPEPDVGMFELSSEPLDAEEAFTDSDFAEDEEPKAE